VYVFRRGNLNTPSFYISTNNKPALCVRFCHKLFKLDEIDNVDENISTTSLFNVPYKMIFAIAT